MDEKTFKKITPHVVSIMSLIRQIDGDNDLDPSDKRAMLLTVGASFLGMALLDVQEHDIRAPIEQTFMQSARNFREDFLSIGELH